MQMPKHSHTYWLHCRLKVVVAWHTDVEILFHMSFAKDRPKMWPSVHTIRTMSKRAQTC